MKIEPLNNDHRLDLGVAIGLSAVLGELRDKSEFFERLSGFNAAIAIVEAFEAHHRAFVAGLNLRAAAAAGIDLQTHSVGMMGRGVIFAELADIEHRARFAADAASSDAKAEARL